MAKLKLRNVLIHLVILGVVFGAQSLILSIVWGHNSLITGMLLDLPFSFLCGFFFGVFFYSGIRWVAYFCGGFFLISLLGIFEENGFITIGIMVDLITFLVGTGFAYGARLIMKRFDAKSENTASS
mgnify:CR=1 FL=1|jgi:hypothetical protein